MMIAEQKEHKRLYKQMWRAAHPDRENERFRFRYASDPEFREKVNAKSRARNRKES